MYWNQVRGRKIVNSSKQATLGDSRETLQNTVDDIEENRMSLVAVNIKYNVQTKGITEIGFFDSTTFVTLNSSSSLQSTVDHVQYMQPRPQGLLLDDVQNGGSSGEGPGKG